MASSAVMGWRRRGREPGEEATDADWVAWAQRDPRYFAALYDRHVDSVFRFCAVRLGDRAEAEDATATVFAQALSALPRFRDDGDSFRRWLFTIAHNVVVSTYRRWADHRPLDDAWAIPDDRPSPEQAALASFEAARVRAALTLLADAQRRVIELRLAGLTGPEIAEVLDRSPDAVKMLQFRALNRLQELLHSDTEREGRES